MFTTIDEILDFAIEKEQEARDYYLLLAGKMENSATRELFENLASQELKHSRQLEEVKRNKMLKFAVSKISQLNFTSFDTPLPRKKQDGSDLSYQNALQFALQREDAAYRLYTQLSQMVDDADMRNLLLNLAEEEADHRKKIEDLYKAQTG